MLFCGTHLIIRDGRRSEQLAAADRWSSWANASTAKYGYESPEVRLALGNFPESIQSHYSIGTAPTIVD
jgi:hypothetical protein